MNNNVKTFIYNWVIMEWYRKNRPEVWSDETRKTFGKRRSSMMRLWTHKCGQFYFKEEVFNCDKPK